MQRRRARLRSGCDLPAALLAETHHLERFFDVQVARLALRVAAVVIVDAVGEIGVLLNFAEHQPGPIVCAVPAGTKIASPGAQGMRSRQSSAVPSAIALLKFRGVTSGFSPTSTSAPGAARNAYHISVLPRPPAACSCRAA